MKVRTIMSLVFLLLITFVSTDQAIATNCAKVLSGPPTYDQYGGNMHILGTATGNFHFELICNRWMMVTPKGNGMFMKAVSGVTEASWAETGTYDSYSAVYLQTMTGVLSPNLASQAADSYPNDVVHPLTGHTLGSINSAIYIGNSVKMNETYFWLGTNGVGGHIEWSYSAGGGKWNPINGTGNPSLGDGKLNTDGSYNFDIGTWIAPGPNGDGIAGTPNSNRIRWFPMTIGFPSDFVKQALPGDPVPRFYIRGIVTKDFTTYPVLNQTYERGQRNELAWKKYSGNGGNYLLNWAEDTTSKLKKWGFNAAGEYSYDYQGIVPSLTAPLPTAQSWQLSGWAMRADMNSHIKNVYAGSVCPPASKSVIYPGALNPDVFDPNYIVAMNTRALNSQVKIQQSDYRVIPEESDHLYGIDDVSHQHIGYVILSQNPHMAQATVFGLPITYTDTKLYSKYAMRDFLRYKYKAASDPLPAFTVNSVIPTYVYSSKPSGNELTALQNLNKAWGTQYTNWDTSSGSLASGNNAYGTGTGFMDENGKSILYQGACNNLPYESSFTNPSYPAVRTNLDQFVTLLTTRYGMILHSAYHQNATGYHPPLTLAAYNPPIFVADALKPYLDAYLVVGDVTKAAAVYNILGKPLFVEDFDVAMNASPLGASGVVSTVTYNPTTKRTTIYAPGFHYVFRTLWNVGFPALPLTTFQAGGTCKYLSPFPPIRQVEWDQVVVDGDYTPCVKPGMIMEKSNWDKLDANTTQADRAAQMIGAYGALYNATGADGKYFVAGIEHWALYDDAVSAWTENENFGLMTGQGNAYDGVEDVKAGGVDANGYEIGAEEESYGNLLGPLSSFLSGTYGALLY